MLSIGDHERWEINSKRFVGSSDKWKKLVDNFVGNRAILN